ncbi:hypothetical protein NG697_12675 [Pseudarthrobacter sp. MDT3-26]|nr:hypothetical protein [Pseudarthrobacter sp. MDT3-26]MCO4263766.1 hypothetical protein [Pseudarthrobacter sp. MDT3-26]
MEISGTVEDADGVQSRITADGGSYEEARAALDTKIPEVHRLIVIRTL